MKKISILLFALLIVFSSCDPQKKIAGNYNYEPECLGMASNGMMTVRSFAKARRIAEGLMLAKRNALEEILFKGLRKGVGCNQLPILGDPNIKEKEQAYFNKFFSENGEFENYISQKPSTQERKMKTSGESNYNFGFELLVDYNKLKEKMKNDNLLKQQ
jgi:hypothetical protein